MYEIFVQYETIIIRIFYRLYNAGLQPNLNPLYPTVNFPVSRKTPMIQSMVEWDHSIKWFLVSFLTKVTSFYHGNPYSNYGLAV